MTERKGPETDASKNTKSSEELAGSQTGREGRDTGGAARTVPATTSPGSAEDAAVQGFIGTKVQADQQALRGVDSAIHTGEDVPMGENPLKSVHRRADARPNTKEFTVEDNKFHFGGDVFRKGEKIHLNPDEYGRARTHLKEKSLKQDEGMRGGPDKDKDDDKSRR